MGMKGILIISIIIIIAVIAVTVWVTTKAYQIKHTVDPLEDNPHIKSQTTEDNHK